MKFFPSRNMSQTLTPPDLVNKTAETDGLKREIGKLSGGGRIFGIDELGEEILRQVGIRHLFSVRRVCKAIHTLISTAPAPKRRMFLAHLTHPSTLTDSISPLLFDGDEQLPSLQVFRIDPWTRSQYRGNLLSSVCFLEANLVINGTEDVRNLVTFASSHLQGSWCDIVVNSRPVHAYLFFHVRGERLRNPPICKLVDRSELMLKQVLQRSKHRETPSEWSRLKSVTLGMLVEELQGQCRALLQRSAVDTFGAKGIA
ncbi:hypothetical protein LTR95_010883 [Oleoguttula sp. CCFEE 5521]